MKTRKTFEKLLKKVPEWIKNEIEKSMSCAHLYDGDMCRLGGSCRPRSCTDWKHYETDETVQP